VQPETSWLGIARLEWTDELRVTAADGDCEAAMGATASSLVGRSLDSIFGIARAEAAQLDARARSDGATVEFFRVTVGDDARWLKVSAQADGARRVAQVLCVDQVLDGAPPVQISKLSSSLSHELRNPLSSIKMAVQTLARNTGLSERDQRRLVIANREIRTMERMLWLLSEYGRDTPPMAESIATASLFQEATALIEPELAERKIQVKIDQAEPSPRIKADVGRLRPVLAQLIMNVAMGQPEGSSLVVAIDLQKGACRVRLVDPSAALQEEDRKKLFEPFGTMVARGAGLSLAALHRVMRAHGGDVTAEPTPGAATGTVYTLTFPQ
jgi:signal transduction histidine kinase